MLYSILHISIIKFTPLIIMKYKHCRHCRSRGQLYAERCKDSKIATPRLD